MSNLKETYELLKGHVKKSGCSNACPRERNLLLETLEKIIIELDNKAECNKKHLTL